MIHTSLLFVTSFRLCFLFFGFQSHVSVCFGSWTDLCLRIQRMDFCFHIAPRCKDAQLKWNLALLWSCSSPVWCTCVCVSLPRSRTEPVETLLNTVHWMVSAPLSDVVMICGRRRNTHHRVECWCNCGFQSRSRPHCVNAGSLTRVWIVSNEKNREVAWGASKRRVRFVLSAVLSKRSVQQLYFPYASHRRKILTENAIAPQCKFVVLLQLSGNKLHGSVPFGSRRIGSRVTAIASDSVLLEGVGVSSQLNLADLIGRELL